MSKLEKIIRVWVVPKEEAEKFPSSALLKDQKPISKIDQGGECYQIITERKF